MKKVFNQDQNTEVELETRMKNGRVFQSLEPKFRTKVLDCFETIEGVFFKGFKKVIHYHLASFNPMNR